MTNSSSSSPRLPKLILIHGMNNNQVCFHPLRDALREKGFLVEMIVLPNHGEKREEVKTLDEALKLFDESLAPHVNEPYVVVAFSQGAKYFQLWLMKYARRKPESYVVLAPAVFINYFNVLNRVFEILPPKFFILSQMPRMFRRYDKLFFWEYRILLEGAKEFAVKKLPSPPALVVIDPKDELVDARKVIDQYESYGIKVHQLKRAHLKKTLGKHHIIFHPDYFSDEEWRAHIDLICSALLSWQKVNAIYVKRWDGCEVEFIGRHEVRCSCGSFEVTMLREIIVARDGGTNGSTVYLKDMKLTVEQERQVKQILDEAAVPLLTRFVYE